MNPEARCQHKKHGEIIDNHTIDIVCGSRFCKLTADEVVVHRFDLSTGDYTTRRYANPRKA
jgi:hypothetical protein